MPRPDRRRPTSGPHDGPNAGPYSRPFSRPAACDATTGPAHAARSRPIEKPVLTVQPTTLWDYPSQHYERFLDDTGTVRTTRAARTSRAFAQQGSQAYEGATPSWVVWQCVRRYTSPGQTVVDPMCGGGTTIDVCADLDRQCIGLDLAPSRPDIRQGDARKISLPNNSADFVFIDPPYSTHINYSEDPRCIGRLDAAGEDQGRAYYDAMRQVIAEISRVLRPGSAMGLFVSDSWRRTQRAKRDVFMPIGFELYARLLERFDPIDIVIVARQSAKIEKGNWRMAAEAQNFYLRGFNYLFLMRKPGPEQPEPPPAPVTPRPDRRPSGPRRP